MEIFPKLFKAYVEYYNVMEEQIPIFIIEDKRTGYNGLLSIAKHFEQCHGWLGPAAADQIIANYEESIRNFRCLRQILREHLERDGGVLLMPNLKPFRDAARGGLEPH